MSRMRLVSLLDRLENIVENSSKIPITNKVMIDRDDALDIIDELRMALPEDIEKAKWIVKERDTILADAQKEGQDVVKKAQQYIQKSINNSTVIEQAKVEAKSLMDEARESSLEMKKEADVYADSVLEGLEKTLSETLKSVKKGRRLLGNEEKD